MKNVVLKMVRLQFYDSFLCAYFLHATFFNCTQIKILKRENLVLADFTDFVLCFSLPLLDSINDSLIISGGKCFS